MFKKNTNIAIVAWIILSLVACDVFGRSRGRNRGRSFSRNNYSSSRVVGRGHRPRHRTFYTSPRWHGRTRHYGRSSIVYRPSSRFSFVLSSSSFGGRRSCGHLSSSCACSTRQIYQDDITVWINNRNGSKTPVILKIDGGRYIGPKGEYYWNMPTEEQLRPLYGLMAK